MRNTVLIILSLLFLAMAQDDQKKKVLITSDKPVQVIKERSHDSEIAWTALQNEIYEIEYQGDNWIKIISEKGVGWVHKKDITIIIGEGGINVFLHRYGTGLIILFIVILLGGAKFYYDMRQRKMSSTSAL